MKRFGTTHWAIIDFVLDGRWHTRLAIEHAVIARHMELGSELPRHKAWRGATTMSLTWMVANDWLLVKPNVAGKEQFKIQRAKKRFYLNWRKAYERDIASGLVKMDGTYKGGHITPRTDAIREQVWGAQKRTEAKPSSTGSQKN